MSSATGSLYYSYPVNYSLTYTTRYPVSKKPHDSLGRTKTLKRTVGEFSATSITRFGTIKGNQKKKSTSKKRAGDESKAHMSATAKVRPVNG